MKIQLLNNLPRVVFSDGKSLVNYLSRPEYVTKTSLYDRKLALMVHVLLQGQTNMEKRQTGSQKENQIVTNKFNNIQIFNTIY